MNLRNAALWSLADQILLSAIHFALGLLVLRSTTREGYGTYVLCWAALLLLAGLANALVNAQMTVRAAGLPVEQQQRTVAVFLAGQTALYGALLVIAFAGAVLCSVIWTPGPAALFVVVALAFGGCALREFVRSTLLMRTDARSVFRVDAMYAFALIVLSSASVALLPAQWLPHAIVMSMGLASLAAAWRTVRSIRAATPPLQAAWNEFRTTLNGGTWAAGGVVVTHIQSQSYVYLLGALAGLAATAEASAARLLLMPASLAFTSVQRVVYPHWVVLARANLAAELTRGAMRMLGATTAGIVAYAVAITLAASFIIPTVMGSAYAASVSYVALFAWLAWCEAVRSIVSMQLQAHARFRIITLCNAVTAVLVVAAAMFAIRHVDARAAIAVQGAGDLLLAVMLVLALRRDASHGQPLPAPALVDSAASR
jgi:O-antigen/teichoic acid export membrane protein